jgi:hypothetical protein
MRVPASEQKPEQHPLRAAPLMQPQAFRSVIRIIPVALLVAHVPACDARDQKMIAINGNAATGLSYQPSFAYSSLARSGLPSSANVS